MAPFAESDRRRRALVAAGGLVALVAASIGYVRFAAAREDAKADRAATASGLPELVAPQGTEPPSTEPPSTEPPSTEPEPEVLSPRALITVNRSPGEEYGAVVRLEADGTATPFGDLRCARVHAGGALGACLEPTPQQDPSQLGVGLEGTQLVLFDPASGAIQSSYPVAGRPSRLRVSADGRYAAYTTFVTGHSYAVASSLFSTNPVIVDTASGVHRNIEFFQFTDASGQLIDDPTRNFWGITFAPADSDTFYAALGIGEENWIVRGSVTGESGTIIADGMMCPSASPDGRYLVGREQARDGRYALLDLVTGERRPLAEDSIVDDQVEWIDDNTVAYAIARDDSPANQPVYDVWTLDIDTGVRTQLARAANSPAVIAVGQSASSAQPVTSDPSPAG